MRILALDTAMGQCSVAIADGDKLLAENMEKSFSIQAEKIFPLIQDTMQQAGLTYDDINKLATTLGPGSFTGVRIGISAIMGIGFARNIPIIGVNTLETIAWRAHAENPEFRNIISLLDAKRGQLYAQSFSANKDGISALDKPSLQEISNINGLIPKNYLVAGNCTKFIDGNNDFTVTEDILPHAATVAIMASHKEAGNISPIYVRKPDAKKPGEISA